MNWTELIKTEAEHEYKTTNGLLDLVDNDRLDWKPSAGQNWMTMAQLLKHITTSCGDAMHGFVTGDWGELPEEGSQLPTVSSVAEAKALLAEDRHLALKMLTQAGEDRLANEMCVAPWNPTQVLLGYECLQMVKHLTSHKSQLFYYLKLQGKPVHTGHLWGG
jgi:uncharacterized damage-inducible protein DinB